MNGRQIFWLAVLLALQAAALSLLQTGQAQASQIYRCEGGYQQQPCSNLGMQSVVEMNDPRTVEQVDQSRKMGRQDVKAYRRLIRQRQREIRKAPKAQAVALSSFKTGDGPFGSSATPASASGSKQQRMHERKNLRIAKVPQTQTEPQAATQAQQ